MTNYTISYLLYKKVPMMQNLKTGEWLKVKITKTGKFFRANGKIISRQFAETIILA